MGMSRNKPANKKHGFFNQDPNYCWGQYFSITLTKQKQKHFIQLRPVAFFWVFYCVCC